MVATTQEAADLLESLVARLRDPLSASPDLARSPANAIATVVQAIFEGPAADHEGNDVAFLKSLRVPHALVCARGR